MHREDAEAVTFELTLDDYRALQAHVCRPVRRPSLSQHLLLGLPGGVVVGVAALVLGSHKSFFAGLLIGFVLVIAFSLVAARRARAATDPQPNGSILCRQEYWLSDEGLRHRTPYWEGVTRWGGLVRVDETERHLFLMIDRAAAYTIPKSAFTSSAHAASFVERVRARLGASTAAS